MSTQALAMLKRAVKRFGAPAVGRKIGVPARTVHRWAAEENAMTAAGRALVLAEYPPPAAPTPAATSTTPTPTSPATPAPAPEAETSSKDRLRKVVAVLERRIARADDDKLESKELAAISNAFTSAERQYARVAGELQLTEAMIVRSAPWARIMKVVRVVLTKYPAAAKELDDAIEKLAEEGGA